MSSVLDQISNTAPSTDAVISFARLDGAATMPVTELWAKASRLAQGLRRLGVEPGDRIGVLAANSVGWVLLDLALLRLGAVTAGLEPGKFAVEPELLARYGLSQVFTDQAVTNSAGAPTAGFRSMAEIPQLMADVDAEPELPVVTRGLVDPVALKFTSGSTGTPKSLTASAGSVDNSIDGVQKLFAHGPGDNLFVFLPLSLLQQRYWVYSALVFGHDITISSYEAALFTLRTARPTVVMGVPAFFEAMQRQVADRAQRRGEGVEVAAKALFGDRIRYLWTGSAPTNPATLEFFTGAGLPIFEGYGMNETCIATKNAPGAVKLGSVGRPLIGKRVVIGDDGVVSIGSTHPVATRYEHAKPGVSEKMFIGDGLIRTGDLGYLDDDGFLFLTGRADDVIVLGNGRKVVVRPIEEFVKRSPAIAECVLYCPNGAQLIAVISPATEPADRVAIEAQVALSNDTLTPDEQIHRTVVADEPFSIDNGLLTSQYKPRRLEIAKLYQAELNHSREGSHV